jgi:sugar phosphate isomerase/epimerase
MRTSRRDFLKKTSIYSAGILAAPALASSRPLAGANYGLQLYTVRDAMAKDPAGTLAKVAAIGYNSLEGATYNSGDEKFYGMDARTFAGVLKKNGQVMRSCHYRYGEDSKGALLTNGVFNGTILHDHNFEFAAQGGVYPYDILLKNTDPNLVKMELDLYWATFAGQDPVKIFEAHPGRFPLWHLKDIRKTPDHDTAEVGSGTVDFKRIFKYKATAGMKYWFVEQDHTLGSPFDSITKSLAYIKQNLV